LQGVGDFLINSRRVRDAGDARKVRVKMLVVGFELVYP
jgi:hypothetical protein